jgi:hypothetical protein
LVAHFGTVLFVPSGGESDPTAAARKLVASLEADPRVLTVVEPELDPDHDWMLPFFPAGDPTSDDLLAGGDAQRYLRTSVPITFHVSVPKKNQRTFGPDEEAPSDKYIAVWNGCSLLTAWETTDDDVPRSGGHVVIDVVQDAARRIDGAVYVQPCSPECDYMFTHVGLLVRPDVDADSTSYRRGIHRGVVEVLIQPGPTSEWLSEMLYLEMMSAMDYFAELKNNGQRVLDIQHSAQHDLISLLFAQHHSVEVSTFPLRKRLGEIWRHRGSRKERRVIAARLLLHAANLEMVRREWTENRLRFEARCAEEDGLSLLFANDHPLDAAAIETISMESARATAEQMTLRLENRAMILATVVGAVAGGLVSVIIR